VTASARVTAQAKINLLLRVLARETSGYHSIETVFLRLDLGDDVTVRITASGRTVDCDGDAIPAGGLGPPEQNLALRAGVTYADATGWPPGFAIEIEKHIPVGAGLGGGSADAGAVLRALDALSPNPLGARLPELAGALGADVPFMALDSPMSLAWGRGERLFPLPVLKPRPVLLAIPNFAVATSDAYAWLAASRGEYVSQAAVISPDAVATWEAMAGVAANDFDDVVAARFPILLVIRDDLRRHDADIAMLSGSGSAVFGVFTTAPNIGVFAGTPDAQWIETRTAVRVVRVEPNQ